MTENSKNQLKDRIDILRRFPTPYYYYDRQLLRSTLDAVRAALPDDRYKVHFAIKACSNPDVMREIAGAQFGADCVSGGEILVARAAGIPMDRTVYAGVGKRDDEIRQGLLLGIECFNVESSEELDVINSIAMEMGKKAPVALRVNPNIDAHTHEYITTGLAENKFGIPMESLDHIVHRCLELEGIDLCGLHFHIGSQVTITEPFRLLCEVINDLQRRFAAEGIHFRSINVGGGLGIDYDNPDANPIPDFKAYFDTFARHLELGADQELHCELGRSIVAQCGSLITQVLYVKKGLTKDFVIVDGGFTDLIRPALYGAHHVIQNLTSDSTEMRKYDVVGPICESTDVFGKDEDLPVTHRGDLIALRSAGAYGEVMASGYNNRAIIQGHLL